MSQKRALKERKTRHEGLLEELERTGQSQVSLTDPDSRAMASRPKVGVGYNTQVAFDAKHKLIVEQPVTNAGSDLGLLAQTAGAAKEVLGVERIEAGPQLDPREAGEDDPVGGRASGRLSDPTGPDR